VVEGWDDARLLTLRGLRNRGYSPEMIKEFIDKVNCSRAGNENVVQYSLLEKEMKKVLLTKAHKTLGVINPFSVIVDNLNDF
jgi:glutaminyl-tRNA synthetase